MYNTLHILLVAGEVVGDVGASVVVVVVSASVVVGDVGASVVVGDVGASVVVAGQLLHETGHDSVKPEFWQLHFTASGGITEQNPASTQS